MPEYTYKCPACPALDIIVHPPGAKVLTFCKVCGTNMRRVYFAPNVNWNGLKPSAGELSNKVKHLIHDAPRRRERYKELKHEAGKD